MEIAINYWAVLVAAVVNMAIGALWYGPVFGKMWMRLSGFTKESMKDMALSPVQAMAGGFILSLVIAYVLGHFIGIVSQLGFSGYALGFWVWLGFAMPTASHGFLWEGKPFTLFVLNVAYLLVAYLAMGGILTAWM